MTDDEMTTGEMEDCLLSDYDDQRVCDGCGMRYYKDEMLRAPDGRWLCEACHPQPTDKSAGVHDDRIKKKAKRGKR